MSIWIVTELLAVISGVVCVYLQTKERISAWPFGIFSVSLSVLIFYRARLYSDVILHVVYVFLNLYGWWHWSKRRNGDISEMEVMSLNKTQKTLAVPAILLASYLWGYAMSKMTNADLVYFDAFTTVGSLGAQLLMTRKIIENWILWILVDLVAINMYLYKGLILMAVLFFIYLVICIRGWKEWSSPIRRL